MHGGKLKIKLCQRKLVFDSQSIHSLGLSPHSAGLSRSRKLVFAQQSSVSMIARTTSACDVYIYYYVLKTTVCPPHGMCVYLCLSPLKVTRNATQSESSRFLYLSTNRCCPVRRAPRGKGRGTREMINHYYTFHLITV